MAGYHKREIVRGTYGEISKIREELAELEDAVEQGVKLMALNEVADLIGAIEGYVQNHFPGFTLADAMRMKDLTREAFLSGRRTPNDGPPDALQGGPTLPYEGLASYVPNCGGSVTWTTETAEVTYQPSTSLDPWKPNASLTVGQRNPGHNLGKKDGDK